MITAQRKSSNAFARALSRDRVLFFCLKYPADTTDRYLQEFLSFHPDLPAHLDDIDVLNQGRVHSLDRCHAGPVLSCNCILFMHNRIITSDGVHNKAARKLHAFEDRMLKHPSYYDSNALISSSFDPLIFCD